MSVGRTPTGIVTVGDIDSRVTAMCGLRRGTVGDVRC